MILAAYELCLLLETPIWIPFENKSYCMPIGEILSLNIKIGKAAVSKIIYLGRVAHKNIINRSNGIDSLILDSGTF